MPGLNDDGVLGQENLFGFFFDHAYHRWLILLRLMPLVGLVAGTLNRLTGKTFRLSVGRCLTDAIDIAHDTLCDRGRSLLAHVTAKPGHGLGVELINSALADAQDFADFLKG